MVMEYAGGDRKLSPPVSTFLVEGPSRVSGSDALIESSTSTG